LNAFLQNRFQALKNNNGTLKTLSTFASPKRSSSDDEKKAFKAESEIKDEEKRSEECDAKTCSPKSIRKQAVVAEPEAEHVEKCGDDQADDPPNESPTPDADNIATGDGLIDKEVIDSGPVDSEPADKGLIDDETRRKLIEDAESLLTRSELRRPKKLRSSDYRLRRKYQQQQRRKNSASSSASGSGAGTTPFLIDEVIVEEDEDALEAENLEVISSRPVVPVKSILKRPSLTSSSGSSGSDDSETEAPKSIRIDHETEAEAATAVTRRRKKGVTFNTCDMGNTASQEAAHQRPLRDADSVAPSASPGPDTEDELTGYSKVVVSHNLAEEILDEIYGKLAQAAESGAEYENADFFSSAAPTPFFLFPDAGEVDAAEPPRSLADEILDELYGGEVKDGDDDDAADRRDDDEDFYEEIRDLSAGSDTPTAKSAAAKKPKSVNPVLAGEFFVAFLSFLFLLSIA
jgi:hypothetical protein